MAGSRVQTERKCVLYSDEAGCHELSPGEVTVWSYMLDVSPEIRERCRSWLSAEEAARAKRFVAARDREWFIVAHGGLRSILGRHIGTAPASLRFQSGPSGKPELRDQDAFPPAIGFNLTHSHGRCLVALAVGQQVGVDVELIRQDVQYLKLAERFFAPLEQAAVAARDSSLQAAAFFRHWVAKEAYLKLKGVGLQFPLEHCHVTVSADDSMATVEWRMNPESVEQGVIRFLRLAEGWVGAVTTEGADWTVRLREWSFE